MPKAESFIDFQTEGFDELSKRFEGSREFVRGALNRALRRMGKTLVPEVKKETPRGATNKLANTTIFQVIGKGEDMTMEIRQSAFSEKGFSYGAAVRTGTRPHFPPSNALIPWVQKKLGIDAVMAPRIAFLVARKISRVGTVEDPYHERAFESKVGDLHAIYDEEMEKLAERLIKE